MRAITLRHLAAGLVAFVSIHAAAQSPSVNWAVSTYGPGNALATLGCGGCASDQRTLAVDAQGDLFVTGFASGATADDMMTVKYAGATGAILWAKTFDDAGNSFDQSWALALDPSGNAVVTGYVWNGTEYDIKTIKYAGADGAILWQATFTGPAAGVDFGIAIATDAAGNVYVGGNVWNGLDDDAKIVKFAAADGAVVWDKTFAGAAGFNDYFYALAVDAAGNVIATGEEQLSSTDSNWKTVKYAAADGAVLWQASFGGTGNGLDIPFSIRVDGSGNVVIAGYTDTGAGLDGKVIKHAAANGAVLWQKEFTGAGGGDDIFYSVALDAAGNAIATGFTFNGSAGNDWSTVKYAAADGAVLWQKALGGSGNLSDVSVAVAVDARGNAIVGGRVNNGSDPANRDIGVAKLAAADGSLVWSYAYAGGAGGFDRVAAVASVNGAVLVAGESLETGNPAGWRIASLRDPVLRAAHDFNGSGTSDVLWRHADGRAAIWLMSGLVAAQTAEIFPAGTGWSVVQAADFDGDGRGDLAWQHNDGRIAIHLMNGTTATATQQILGAGGWSVTHAPDLDGDGRADLVFTHADGTVAAWTMNGTTMTGGATLFGAGSGWRVVRTGDFDGDGRHDLLWKHTDGRHAIWLMNGTAVNSTAQVLGPGGWTATHVADLDGDGRADIVWRHDDGSIAAWLMNGSAFVSGSTLLGAGTGWSVARVGDFDGDGKADLFFQHTDGRAAIYLMDGTTPAATAQILNAGGGWSARRLSDLNGDGKADIVWENVDGRVAVWLMSGVTMAAGSTLLGPGTGWGISAAGP